MDGSPRTFCPIHPTLIVLMKNWHLIAYDIRDPKRLRLTATLLEGYGQRIQYSLFRCHLTSRLLQKVRWELTQILSTEDSLLIIPLCDHCAAKITVDGRPAQWDSYSSSYGMI